MKNNLLDNLIKFVRFFLLKYNPNTSQYMIVKLLLVGCIFSTLISPYGDKVIAQENAASNDGKTFKVTFNPPDKKSPQKSRGGASRTIGQCINQTENSDVPFAPLLPAESQGLTVASHPTVLAYLPETTAQKALFSWQDENNKDHYQTVVPIQNQGGIISLTLPEDAPPLEVGKNYQWALAVMCNSRLQPDSPVIQGQIQRVAKTSALSDRLKNASALETAAIYGEAGIWYETVAVLTQLRTTQPNNSDLTLNWQELLTSVGLEKVATTPLVKENSN